MIDYSTYIQAHTHPHMTEVERRLVMYTWMMMHSTGERYVHYLDMYLATRQKAGI